MFADLQLLCTVRTYCTSACRYQVEPVQDPSESAIVLIFSPFQIPGRAKKNLASFLSGAPRHDLG